PHSQTQRVYPGLDALLWALPVLPPLTSTRGLAATPPAHVSLEARAVRAHQSPRATETGDGQENGDPDRAESQRAVEAGTDARAGDRDDQSVALGNAGTRLDSRLVDCTSLSNTALKDTVAGVHGRR